MSKHHTYDHANDLREATEAERESAILCEGCGAFIASHAAKTHARYHSVLSSHAWAIAILRNTHLAANVHDKYDAVERIKARTFDNWSADALAEVMRGLPAEVTEDD